MFWNKYWKRTAKSYRNLSEMYGYRSAELNDLLTESEQRVKDLEDIKADLEAELDHLHQRLYGSGSF